MIFNKIEDWIRQNSFFQKVFKDAIWKAKRLDMVMNSIQLNTESKYEENKFIRFETERTMTIDVDVIKLLNLLGIKISDTVKLNIIDNRDIGSNLFHDNKHKIEIIIPD